MTGGNGNTRRMGRLPEPSRAFRESREFFDQLFTQVIKGRFKGAADESVRRQMNIVAGSCTSCRCQLTADGCTMVIVAGRMLSSAPEIWLTLTGPAPMAREPLCTVLRFSTPHGWITSQIDEPVGDLTVWLEGAIAFFLDWASDSLLR